MKSDTYRDNLKPLVGQRREFIGTVQEHGIGVQNDIMFQTLLVCDIHNVGKDGEPDGIVADHAWIHSTVSDISRYQPGDTISFSAVVDKYKSGYRKRKMGLTKEIKKGYCFAGVVVK